MDSPDFASVFFVILSVACLCRRGKPRLGLPSVTDKLAVPKTGAPSTIIIKPDNPQLPSIVENEAYCMILVRFPGERAQ